eukprot:scaffold206144_cov53-Cyclotella_meneghiniana.AAC.1
MECWRVDLASLSHRTLSCWRRERSLNAVWRSECPLMWTHSMLQGMRREYDLRRRTKSACFWPSLRGL